jgi:hypothetical protein
MHVAENHLKRTAQSSHFMFFQDIPEVSTDLITNGWSQVANNRLTARDVVDPMIENPDIRLIPGSDGTKVINDMKKTEKLCLEQTEIWDFFPSCQC